MGKWAWFPLVGSIIGTLIVFVGSFAAESGGLAQQLLTLGIAFAVIPYMFARAISEIGVKIEIKDAQEQQDKE